MACRAEWFMSMQCAHHTCSSIRCYDCCAAPVREAHAQRVLQCCEVPLSAVCTPAPCFITACIPTVSAVLAAAEAHVLQVWQGGYGHLYAVCTPD
jgi:hypothetical protein